MNDAYLSAVAALAGSAIGGLTSFLSSWLGQGAQLRAQLFLYDKGRRQELYRDFVDQASALYIDAQTHDTPDLSKVIGLYALVNRMRIISSAKVIDEAEQVARQIVETYPQQNKTFDDLRKMINEHAVNPLERFSEACREELHRREVP